MIDFGLQILVPFFDLFTNPSSRTHWIGLLVFSSVFVGWYGFRESWKYIQHCFKQKSIHLDIQLLVFNRDYPIIVDWFSGPHDLANCNRNNQFVSIFVFR